MAANTTIHGSRDPQTQLVAEAEIDHYFAVLGNSEMFFLPALAGFDADAGYQASKHVVDFGGSLDHCKLVIEGNARTQATTFTIRINDVDSGLTVTVPALTDDEYEMSGGPVSFVAGDSIVGYASSPTTGSAQYSGLIQVTIEMTPTSGVHTCFRAGVGGDLSDNGTARSPIATTIPLNGSVYHYNTYQPTVDDLGDLATVQVPSQMDVRAPGTITYLQACFDANSPGNAAEIYVDVNTLPAVAEGSKALSVSYDGEATRTYILDETGSMSVVSGDKASYSAVLGAGSVNTLWSVGCNFEGSGSLVDLMTSEMAGQYFDRSHDRATSFDYNDDGSADPNDREFIVTPIGTFWPVLRADIPGDDLGIPNPALRPYSITPSFAMQLSHLRVYVDTFDTDSFGGGASAPIRVQILIDGFAGDVFVDVTEPGWYADDNTTDSIEVGRSWCYSILAGAASPSDSYLYVHISSITISYGASAAAGGSAGPREVPEPDPITPEPCVTHRARCWKITREDGTIYAYTEHDRDITYGGTTYAACGGLIGSASEIGAVLGETGNQELAGYLSDLGIAAEDLISGKFTNAAVVVSLIPYGDYIIDEAVIPLCTGNFGVVTQGDTAFSAEALTPTAQMARKSLLSVVTRTCPNKLGDSRCGVNLASYTVAGSVTILASSDGYELTAKRTFTDGTRFEADGYFDGGTITWVTGDNAGQTTDIKSYEDGVFTLWDPMISAIAFGDTYTATPGCDRTSATCAATFNNFNNFRGFEFLPGPDAIAEFPQRKST